MKDRPKGCPCTSGLPYATCCAPAHRGEQDPADCPALVRARFAAFALRDGAFLAKTLHPEHELARRALVEPLLDLPRLIAEGARALRFMTLRILDHEEGDELGIARVLFRAGIFERGRDRSFVELSEFERVRGAWRYLDGRVFPADDGAPTTIEAARALEK